MTAPARAVPFADGLAVLQHLARTGLPALRPNQPTVEVFTKVPDALAKHLPALVIRRTGGASDDPRFTSQYWTHLQVWDRTNELAYLLSQQVSRLYYEAWENQTTTPHGHIAKWRESSGFQDFTDSLLPHFGRYDCVLDLLIRNVRAPRD